MIKLKRIEIKNFLSIGNIAQSLDLDRDPLTLILGENADSPNTNGARNGVGKSTVAAAIAYALYGTSLNQVKKNNLINKTNNKNMSVILDFEKNGVIYRIERGRKPTFLRWIVNNKTVGEESNDNSDESEGDSRWTQKEIEKTFGMSANLFKYIMLMNTFTEPFLSLPVSGQRAIIEELLGVTQLSLKADLLKEKIKETKRLIEREEIRLQATRDANSKVQRTIDELKSRSVLFERGQAKKIKEFTESIDKLSHVDIDKEIEDHKTLALFSELQKQIRALTNDRNRTIALIEKDKQSIIKAQKDLELLQGNMCPLCEQEIHDHKHEELGISLEERIKSLEEQIKELEEALVETNQVLEPLEVEFKILEKPVVHYSSIDEAYNHRKTIDQLTHNLQHTMNTENSFIEQIESLTKTGLQELDFGPINEFSKLQEHQEYLLKFLVSKDSFIRKKIIDQNLNYLNIRLSHYLDLLNLPHKVKFMNDLSVEITELGLDYDFDNLSRGEKTRLILGLNWAFRDVFESMNDSINLLFIDEMIDNGLDLAGVESALNVLKKISRDRQKNIFLISHREELIGRVNQILLVIKENGFSTLQLL